MKKSPFFMLFVGVNIIGVVLYIHKASQCLQLSYEKQTLEEQKKKVAYTQQQLTHQLYAAQDMAQVSEYAQAQQMIPLDLKQVKRIERT